jgi:hypothetical protein
MAGKAWKVDEAALDERERVQMAEALGVMAAANAIDIMVSVGGVVRMVPGLWLRKLVEVAADAAPHPDPLPVKDGEREKATEDMP